jgi:hypothetical protein
MKSRLTELMGITLLGVTKQLLKWNRGSRVIWSHIDENGEAKENTEEDFEKAIIALSNDDFQGTFIISIVNGSAIVGWNINGKNGVTK